MMSHPCTSVVRVFEELVEAVEEWEIPSDSAALVAALRLQDRVAAKVTMAVAAFDANGSWDVDGDTSMTAWLRHHGTMTSRDATVSARTGRRLRAAPVTADAWVDGTLSGGQVAAVVANVNDDTAHLWAEHETEVVPTIAALPVADVATAMRVWATRADAIVDPAERAEPEQSLHLSTTLDGRGRLNGSLDPETTTILHTALHVATTQDDDEAGRTPASRRADALADICRFFLDHQQHTPAAVTAPTST